MKKSVKRTSNFSATNAVNHKKLKLFDFTNVCKDISVLERLYDFIETSECNVVDEYLSHNDFNDLLNYFNNYSLYKPDELCLLFNVCRLILFHISGDEDNKHSLSGQSFAEAFLTSHKPIIYLYLSENKSNKRIISCLKFISALILQSRDIAMKVAMTIDFNRPIFSNLLNIRNLKAENDVHSTLLDCYASFFLSGSSLVIRKVCEEKFLIGNILKDLRFDRCQNVQLIIDILHEKIIKNSSISKTTKVKTFSVSHLKFLLSVYDWKGATVSYDAFLKKIDLDDNCIEIYDQLHSLLMDLCASHQNGIAFVDNLLSQSPAGNLNKKLHFLIISESMQDFFTHKQKHELLMSILTTCPDLVSPFVEYLVTIMIARKPEYWGSIFKHVLECYQLLTTDRINNILTEAWTYNKGDKFVKIASIICLPVKTLIDIIQANDSIHINCEDDLRSLRNRLIDNCEKVITWINVTNVISSQKQKISVKSTLEAVLMENFTKCNWDRELKSLLSEELSDETIFIKPVEENELEKEPVLIEEPVSEETSALMENMRKANNETEVDGDGNKLLRECFDNFSLASSTSFCLLKLIFETLSIGRFSLKKKYKRQLMEILTTEEFFSQHWTPLNCQEELYNEREEKRNHILNVITSFVQQSRQLKKEFYSRVHPLRLLSVYSGTLSDTDQKIFYLITLSAVKGVLCSPYNFILFGRAVSEHYSFPANKPPMLSRPIINSQTFNLLEDDKMYETINRFPISRISGFTEDFRPKIFSSQSKIYDPCFLLQWLSQIIPFDPEKSLELSYGIDLKILFSKQIISFLIACQASECLLIRLFSRLQLGRILSIFLNTENEIPGFSAKFLVGGVIGHFLNTISDGDQYLKVSSIFTNYYVRMLQLISSPGKKLYSPLLDILNAKEKFDSRYVPNFLQLLYSADPNTRLLQLWILDLLSHSIKSIDDFRILMNSQVLAHVLALYGCTSDPTIKVPIIRLLDNCVSISAVAEKLFKFHGFVSWLTCQAVNNLDKINHKSISVIVKKLVISLKNSKVKIVDQEEFKRIFKLYFPEIDFQIC